MRFRSSDGRRLTGTFSPARGRAPAVVLTHQFRGGPDQFAGLAPVLHDAGYATLGGKGVKSFVAPVSGHGVALIPDADVRDQILAWLRPRLGR